MAKLTIKQELFVKEYLVDFNATQAAIRAGYSENVAHQQGAENLKKPYIKDAIQKEKEAIKGNVDKHIIGNIRFWEQIRDNPESSESARLKASELLGKYRAMFTDRIEHSTIDENGEKTGFQFVTIQNKNT